MPNESVDLIYIDPPFNTRKLQKRTTIRTVRDENGDRRGFKGNTYRTIELGTKSFRDHYDSYIDGFLKPRLEEAYRVLKPHGSLYFHIDYREVHYCKILLDNIFGRECFTNEIIWAYDFGGRARSRWPPKHDNILFYVKDPKKYIYNTSELDREQYMAPGLVGPEKAKRGKLPTDTWWPDYVGKRPTDTWWQTIVGTNSRERKGYPTQKPRQLVDRIIKASSYPGNLVLDFFAGTGTVGESCLKLNRSFILIDNNQAALEVIAQRFTRVKDIEWINFDPIPFQTIDMTSQEKEIQDTGEHSLSPDFQMLAATASYLQTEIEEQSDFWKNSPFEWVLLLSSAKKGKLARRLVDSWCMSKDLPLDRSKSSSHYLTINGNRIAIKMSTRWTDGKYKFQQIRDNGYDYVICLGISPRDIHCWVFKREYAIKNATPQHKGAKGAEYWIAINPDKPSDWVKDLGGTLDQAYVVLKGLKKK